MRVKQTAKKITTNDEAVDSNSMQVDQENCNNHSSDNANDLSDNEVEFLVECRTDTEGNQFLLDGTLVIEPAPVAESSNEIEPKPKSNQLEEIDFASFIKEMQSPLSDKANINAGNHQTALKNKQILPAVIPQITVKCTGCNAKFNPHIGGCLHKHPVLEVILCKDCIENQKDKYFIIDEEDNKETLCRWCVEGGSLICCDFCSKSYCKTCIKRNLGRTVLSEILNQDDSVQWKCFSCDTTPIKILQEACTKVFSDVSNLNECRRKLKTNKKAIPRIESVNKKRTIGKAFPLDVNIPIGLSNAKLLHTPTPKPVNTLPTNNANHNTINLLNNMQGFGTDWYMRNVNLESILMDIDKVDSRTLLHAINSTKKCVEAFYSDIRNLENEICKASSSTDILGIVSMFKSVYRHHIFNRFCQLQSRIEEDRKTRFVPQTINGESKKHSIQQAPNIVINSVMSHAQLNNINNSNNNNNKRIYHSFTPNLIAKDLRQMTNGDRKSTPVMYSIDLTDDIEKTETSSKPIQLSLENDVPEIVPSSDPHESEIVDLCNDDDASSMTSPVVYMNLNNQLFSENKS